MDGRAEPGLRGPHLQCLAAGPDLPALLSTCSKWENRHAWGSELALLLSCLPPHPSSADKRWSPTWMDHLSLPPLPQPPVKARGPVSSRDDHPRPVLPLAATPASSSARPVPPLRWPPRLCEAPVQGAGSHSPLLSHRQRAWGLHTHLGSCWWTLLSLSW